ncbi:hypothetical protein BJF90_32270 [Pseudonocardia sp. CNS-004]|nr:hypothetical protein BJF90_32270 [Pseudonocardia sp. CNS-004]
MEDRPVETEEERVMDRRDGLRPVVVGVDGSEQALRAVRWGAAEAARHRVPPRMMGAFAWLGPQGAGHRNLEEGGDRGAS